jgi:hypothetical protein
VALGVIDGIKAVAGVTDDGTLTMVTPGGMVRTGMLDGTIVFGPIVMMVIYGGI